MALGLIAGALSSFTRTTRLWTACRGLGVEIAFADQEVHLLVVHLYEAHHRIAAVPNLTVIVCAAATTSPPTRAACARSAGRGVHDADAFGHLHVGFTGRPRQWPKTAVNEGGLAIVLGMFEVPFEETRTPCTAYPTRNELRSCLRKSGGRRPPRS